MDLNIIKKFPYAFSYERDFQQSDYNNFFNEEMIENCKDIEWIYWSNEQEYCLIGIEGCSIYAIKDEGELAEVCEGLENIPYELLRVLSESGTDGSVKDILQYNKDIEFDLSIYEKWCKENYIELDKNHIYHNENGELFTHYFDKYEKHVS